MDVDRTALIIRDGATFFVKLLNPGRGQIPVQDLPEIPRYIEQSGGGQFVGDPILELGRQVRRDSNLRGFSILGVC